VKSVDAYVPADSYFGKPYVDVDEERSEPTPHRYLHGGFDETDTRFSIYLPPADGYEGRMMQIFGGAAGGDENSAQTISMILGPFDNAFGNGAYLVESNQGHIGPSMDGVEDITVLQGRADAETARLSHAVAEEYYGSGPTRSYCYGGSGGGNFTLWAMECAPDLYDGGVPFMFGGSPFALTLNAARLLEPAIDKVVDATNPGGSGNPFDGLDTMQREALAALYRAGFQRGAETQLRMPMPEIGWPGVHEMARGQDADPQYFEDFWTEPGYVGSDGLLASQIVHEKVTVDSVVTCAEIGAVTTDPIVNMLISMLLGTGDTPIGIRVTELDARRLTGARVRLDSGAAAGREWSCFMVAGDVLLPAGLGAFFDPALVEGVVAGDAITVDNRPFLAYCYSGRHKKANSPNMFEQYTVAGTPIYPQRDPIPGWLQWTGKFAGKVILLQWLRDRPCWPSVAVDYQRLVREHLGDGVDDQFRLWWGENAQHVPAIPGLPGSERVINYGGIVSQAIKDVIAWVEEGISPAPSTAHEFVDGQVVLSDPSRRGGIQPAIALSIEGEARGEVAVETPIELAYEIAVPEGTGAIVSIDWDLDGSGLFATPHPDVDGTSTTASGATTVSFAEPGMHFVGIRAVSHRAGDMGATSDRIENIARVRVIVH
jgi:hypothetical protein